MTRTHHELVNLEIRGQTRRDIRSMSMTCQIQNGVVVRPTEGEKGQHRTRSMHLTESGSARGRARRYCRCSSVRSRRRSRTCGAPDFWSATMSSSVAAYFHIGAVHALEEREALVARQGIREVVVRAGEGREGRRERCACSDDGYQSDECTHACKW